jgi:arginine-tRNA-protein transferase
METVFHYVAAPTQCGYLADQTWTLEYQYVSVLSADEYQELMVEGWRRFGTMLFRPVCPQCQACRSLRVVVDRFAPNRNQRRVMKANRDVVTLRIGRPSVTRAKLDLYDRYHAHQADAQGWPHHAPKDASAYADSFVHHPFDVEEWCYYLGDRLVGVGYVDGLDPVRSASGRLALTQVSQEPLAGGLSAIYFYYDPDYRRHSLGTYNVLTLIEEARRRGLPYAYLGFYVEGCSSMEYKPTFTPNQIRDRHGHWHDFRD